MSKRIPIYFVPGLGAGPKIFEYISLPEDQFELHYLDWLLPESSEESLSDYAKRMTERIREEYPVLIGVSFGGMLVQEMSKLIPVRKTIIISSLRSSREFPKRLIWMRRLHLYKLLPTRKISNIDDFSRFSFHQTVKKKAELYNRYMSVRNEKYLNWAIKTILHWEEDRISDEIVHIHGTRDEIFPIRHVKDCIPVEGGTHAMIITKAKRISTLIRKSLDS
jgi:pimeloyl-ACP methyl ester carboxylesterase